MPTTIQQSRPVPSAQAAQDAAAKAKAQQQPHKRPAPAREPGAPSTPETQDAPVHKARSGTLNVNEF
jgi:hypothetical protein